jgi:hypothetical protein
MTLDRIESGLRHAYSCRADVLRLQVSLISGKPTVTRIKVDSQIDPWLPDSPGELMCCLALGRQRPGSKRQLPTAAGVPQARTGRLMCDVTSNLLAGDALRMQPGSAVAGMFELRATPNVAASPFGGLQHIETDVIEVAAQGATLAALGTTAPLVATEQSDIRHWYDSRVSVYRKSNGRYVKLTSMVDTQVDVAGEMMCFLAIGVTRPGVEVPIVAGRAPDRVGVLFCDFSHELQAEDRIKVIAGPNPGIFEVLQRPDIAQSLSYARHMEVDIIECAKSTAGTFVE